MSEMTGQVASAIVLYETPSETKFLEAELEKPEFGDKSTCKGKRGTGCGVTSRDFSACNSRGKKDPDQQKSVKVELMCSIGNQ